MTKADEVVKQLSAELEDQFEMACVESGSNQGRISLEGLAKNLLLRIDSMGLCLMPKEAPRHLAEEAVIAIHKFAVDPERGFHAYHGFWGPEALIVFSERIKIGYRAMVEAGAIRLEEQV